MEAASTVVPTDHSAAMEPAISSPAAMALIRGLIAHSTMTMVTATNIVPEFLPAVAQLG